MFMPSDLRKLPHVLQSAIARVIAEGETRTYDMGGKDSTLDVAKTVANYAAS